MIRVVKDSAGHILAEQFGFDGIERYLPPVVADRARQKKKRRPRGERRKLPLTLLRLLSHHPMTKKLSHPGRRKAKQARRLGLLQARWQPTVSP